QYARMAARRNRQLGGGAQACGCRVTSQSDALITAVIEMLDHLEFVRAQRERRRLARQSRQSSQSEVSTEQRRDPCNAESKPSTSTTALFVIRSSINHRSMARVHIARPSS